MNRQPMFTPQQLLSYVAVCETASFTRAAGRVHLSQSTVSQQVRRLEEMLGKALLVRTSHQVTLTEEGEKMLAYARRIITLNGEAWDVMGDTWRDGVLRLGVPEDFAAPTAGLLADFSRAHPQLRLDVMSGMYVDLHRAWLREELDIMLIKQPGGERPLASRPEPLLWLDSQAHPCFTRSPVPLVVFPQQGLYREEMCQALDQLARSWRISYSSASLAALASASEAGLGLTLLPASCRLPGHRVLGLAEGLPPVTHFELALFCRLPQDALQQTLAQALAEFCHLQWQ